MVTTRSRAWGGPPLALQILGLLIAALVVAQLVTLFLTLLLPPEPPARYGLEDIARGLRGQSVGGALERTVQSGPPDLSGRGWLVSETSRRELAKLVGARPEDVTLAFYTRLPFAGSTLPAAMPEPADARPVTAAHATLPHGAAHPHERPTARPVLGLVATIPVAAARPANDFGQSGAPGGGAPGGGGGGGAGGGGFPGSRFPGGTMGGGFPRSTALPGRADPIPRTTTRPSQPAAATSLPTTTSRAPALPSGVSGPVYDGPIRRSDVPRLIELPHFDLATRVPVPVQTVAPEPVARRPLPAPSATATHAAREERDAPAAAPAAPPPVSATVESHRAMPAPRVARVAEPSAVPLRAPVRGLFGLTAAPFIEGDFVAALRQPDGRYALLAPKPEGFPNAWQRRVLLWFVLSLALVAPVAWGFTRRIVRPLQGFADAAEALGRDPSAAILPLDGPAEVGRAAHAFNLMQNRLRAFVDDRTAMVGAISHDLRTPLTRMRFRVEDVPEEQQEGLLEEVAEMEAMITSVLEFIRDASTPGVRERLDLSDLVGTVVRDAKMVGGDVRVESTISAPVEVDAVGMRRLLDNLLENAVKYGIRARVQLSTEGGEAIARIVDDGPGIPEDEMERAFEPFYRSASARASEKAGSGLGLAVCRSIARAHGGDVRLLHSAEGFIAQVNVPLAYDGYATAA